MDLELEERALRVAPIHKSLIRPQLIFGCDRVLFILSLLLTILLIFPGGLGAGNYINVVLGIAFFIIAQRILVVLAKAEPSSVSIFRRSIRYRGFYPATALVERK
ncbi:conjugal transfer protein TrbD [Jonquetella anthropi]|uniref:conjugal transfer protein TrbD n=1 Tax=Jonquetella anthropi TaxID=428712 RepID=UPI0001B9126C|nr:conjugal transfer protein TrbD [Jonquetella anthropi]EEX47767.1 conjugal transfer protein TrbD [Jonquetella anthropi E3_33 E1]